MAPAADSTSDKTVTNKTIFFISSSLAIHDPVLSVPEDRRMVKADAVLQRLALLFAPPAAIV
jgi:hypothetical protein